MKGFHIGHGWKNTATGYVSPCGRYTVTPVGAMTDDGTRRPSRFAGTGIVLVVFSWPSSTFSWLLYIHSMALL